MRLSQAGVIQDVKTQLNNSATMFCNLCFPKPILDFKREIQRKLLKNAFVQKRKRSGRIFQVSSVILSIRVGLGSKKWTKGEKHDWHPSHIVNMLGAQ